MIAKFNFSIAAAAVSSWWWLEPLQSVSQVAAALVPFFGIALIVMQMIRLRKNK